jgi:hypothetical protein
MSSKRDQGHAPAGKRRAFPVADSGLTIGRLPGSGHIDGRRITPTCGPLGGYRRLQGWMSDADTRDTVKRLTADPPDWRELLD